MPDVPAVPRTTGLKELVEAAFSAGGALAVVVEGYEPREGQRRMATAVASVVEDGGTLLAEAGTGTGKTLAYLIPAILSRQRVLVSTGTKNLQEQIFFKDLPALQAALDVPFTATLMKGRSNYLCLHRWEIYRTGVEGGSASAGPLLFDSGDRVLLPILENWAKTTETGDRAELEELPEELPLWKDVAADAETCLGSECSRYDECFVTLMRQRAAESDVVIVNHHLLCADASVRQGAYGEVIPTCATLVVDEAHQLENVATQHFGTSCSSSRIDDTVRDARRLLATPTADSGGSPEPETAQDLSRSLDRVADRGRRFFARLESSLPIGTSAAGSRLRYTAESLADYFDDGMMLAGALEGLEAACALAAAPAPGAAGEHARAQVLDTEALDGLQRRAADLRGDLPFLVRASDPDFVYYLEARGRGVMLRASPINVSTFVREALLDRMRSTILTSATLAIDGSFEYIKGRLGIRHADEIQVEPEFDYAQQALLYLPQNMPPPRSPLFAPAVAREAIALITRSHGRAFVLFTSYAVLRTVQPFIESAVSYPVFVQGTLPRSVLLDEFRRTPNSVLLATSSFWQGVDVVGEALSCVIIDKLPFASPADPVTAARIEAINAASGDAFAEYQVPLAILSLQQGLGRLLRHRTDRGVLAVLDPRLRTMGYGRRFLESLPPAPVTNDLGAVAQFFM